MTTSSPSSASSAAHQVRLYLQRETVARLLDLQAKAVVAGRRKPTYSELIDALVAQACADGAESSDTRSAGSR